MRYAPEKLLSALLEAAHRPTAEAPRDARGLYGLVDHLGDIRYIGATSSADQTFYARIHQRHRTGSEDKSHYFSRMYNTGRMWRDRNDAATEVDGGLAKKLRNSFVADHCRAVWHPLPDAADIRRLEEEVLAIAPDHAIAWNRRKMQAYDEPTELVDATLRRLRWGTQELAAIERQRQLFLGAAASLAAQQPAPVTEVFVRPFPTGPFRFFAMDVETANNDRASICQIGVACVRPDNSIETWVTYIDPQADRWVFTNLHGISARTVKGAPTFAEVLPILQDALAGRVVYQHSSFDSTAVSAACLKSNLSIPAWDWRDSVHVARTAWPELLGNGGHGLASLKRHLGLVFNHHDAGEDARAAAEVVLRAEGRAPVRPLHPVEPGHAKIADEIEDDESVALAAKAPVVVTVSPPPTSSQNGARTIGTTEITQGNIDNDHLYLRNFFDKFPTDAIGGSNRSSVAQRELAVDWGGGTVVMTDLDGKKRIFRRRDWVREFFARNGARAGDIVLVDELAPYSYRVVLQRR